MKRYFALAATAALFISLASAARCDVVTDWNATLSTAIRAANIPAGTQPRIAAIVQTAVFDAVNGIDRKYDPYFVTAKAPRNSNRQAAAAQSAYTALVAVFPAQQPTFDAQLAISLAAIHASTASIARGRAWGQKVALAVATWRSHDGYNTVLPPFIGGTAPGIWRCVPPAVPGTPAILRQYSVMTPFAMTSPWQFRPGPPPALTSAQYAADVNEVKALGRATGSIRTDDQTNSARLWHAVGTADENAVLRSVLPAHLKLVDEARMFALVNIAGADGFINVMDGKYTYNLWRPFHAITLADPFTNPATTPDPGWTSLILPTPGHQEYPSAHATVSGAILHMMENLLGDEHTFVLSSPGYPSFTLTYTSFSSAALGVQNARVWGGLHFRTAVVVGGQDGAAIADYIFANFMTPLENHEDEGDDNNDD